VTLERETLQVVDGQGRIAQIDTRTQGNDNGSVESRRFQLSNHLGSVALELDQQAADLISYEEYHPYGSTAYHAARSLAEGNLKRHRFAGKERDRETSLHYYGARYYACWLGRWTSCDPLRMTDGVNVYWYARDRPTALVDPKAQPRRAGSDQEEAARIQRIEFKTRRLLHSRIQTIRMIQKTRPSKNSKLEPWGPGPMRDCWKPGNFMVKGRSSTES
jgi:RHS repeat-associated protein